jgi:hypothetical protein
MVVVRVNGEIVQDDRPPPSDKRSTLPAPRIYDTSRWARRDRIDLVDYKGREVK